MNALPKLLVVFLLVVPVVVFGQKSKKKSKEVETASINTGQASSLLDGNELESGEIYQVVQEMPRFSDCEEMDEGDTAKKDCPKRKMLNYIYTNLRYPQKAMDNGIEGIAVVSFIIEKDGKIKVVKVLKDLKNGCGEEAKRIILSMPTWIPGKEKGKAVRVQYNLPIHFQLPRGRR